MEWLTTVLAQDALGGPAALRRTPLQAATGTAIRLINVPAAWSARGLDRAIDTDRATPGYDELNVSGAVMAVKDLTAPADIRTIIAHEEANKNRHGVISAAQTRLAAIAQEVVGIN